MTMNKEIALRINKSFSESWIKGMSSLRICIPLEHSCKKSKERRDKGNRKNNQRKSGVLCIQPARGLTHLTCPIPFRSQFQKPNKNVLPKKRAVLIGKLSFSNLRMKARWWTKSKAARFQRCCMSVKTKLSSTIQYWHKSQTLQILQSKGEQIKVKIKKRPAHRK